MNYENEEKAKLVRKYFELPKSKVPVSVRTYTTLVYRKINILITESVEGKISAKKMDSVESTLFITQD